MGSANKHSNRVCAEGQHVANSFGEKLSSLVRSLPGGKLGNSQSDGICWAAYEPELSTGGVGAIQREEAPIRSSRQKEF